MKKYIKRNIYIEKNNVKYYLRAYLGDNLFIRRTRTEIYSHYY